MNLEGHCTFNFSKLPSGIHQDPYLSKVFYFLERFVGQEFENSSAFERQLFQWVGYSSRQQLNPRISGPRYDIRRNEVYVANELNGYCPFGKLVYFGKEELWKEDRSSL